MVITREHPAVNDQIFVKNYQFHTHLHLPLPLILIVFSS